MTGQELQTLLIQKWGYSYDVQIRRMPDKIYFQVMWRFLEQASFPMDESEYLDHLNQVVIYLEALGNLTQIKQAIEQHKDRPRLGKAISISIDLGGRASEWMLD